MLSVPNVCGGSKISGPKYEVTYIDALQCSTMQYTAGDCAVKYIRVQCVAALQGVMSIAVKLGTL